jgi:Protein of unknown function (DUF3375)
MYFQLENSPVLALLHKRHASVLLSFFQKAFRDSNISEVPEERLEGRWEVFIEEDVALSDWEGETPTNTAKFYLEEWCKHIWLARRYSEKEGTYLYRLTTHSEQALLFVEQHLTASRRAFVGTESNFSKIWHSLTELAEKTQTDPLIREKQLLAERDRIDAEIMELRQTKTPRKLDHTAVKSRLYDLIGMTNRFLADFRSVEDSFRKQRDDIQNLYLEQEQSRGDILEGALDAVELLKDSDEGRSFFGFQRMLRSSDDVEKLRHLTQHSLALARQYDIDTGILHGLVGRLLDEVNRTQHTYSAIAKQLHIVVEESFRRERRLLLEIVAEIKKHAHLTRADPPLQIETTCYLRPDINPLLGLKFFERRIIAALNTTIHGDDESKRGLDAFFSGIGPDLRLEQLLKIIREELEREPQVALSALVERHPLRYGTIDLLCYIFAAGQAERHHVMDEEIEVALSSEPKRVARLPEIIFHRGPANV